MLLIAGLSAGCTSDEPEVFGPQLSLAVATQTAPTESRAPWSPLPSEWPKRSNIILISVDTLRADHVNVYGYERDVSPAITRLAANGVVFEQAFVNAPKTSPSLVSIMTGLEVKEHKIHELRTELDEAVPVLAEALQGAGYSTAGFCGQFNCSRRWGFGRGFDHYDDRFEFEDGQRTDRVGGGFYPASEKRAAYLVEEAISWLKVLPADDAPYFIWLHFMDPHAGYAAPSPYTQMYTGRSQFSANSLVGPKVPTDLINQQARVEGIADYDYYVNQYDAEIRYMDNQIGRFLTYLEAEGAYDDALVIFTADHGEYMGETADQARYFSHGSTLYDSEIKVPLIVKLPGNRFGGRRSAELASLIDITPTALEHAGLEADHLQSYSLGSPSPDGNAAGRRDAVFVQSPREIADFAVRTQSVKLMVRTGLETTELVRRLKDGETVDASYRLFDLSADPLERIGTNPADPDTLRDLSDRLVLWLTAENRLAVADTERALLDEDTARHLRSLGYME
jgi:arylsulfatase A-like enzyme